MTDAEDHLSQLVQVARRRLEARAQEAETIREAHALFRLLVNLDGLNPRQASDAIRAKFVEAGFTQQQIEDLGVSEWNLRKVVGGRR